MPSLGFGEIIVIVLIALIVFGPKRLPEIGRSVGKGMREFRRATSEFRADLESGLDAEPPTVPSPAARRAAEARKETPSGGSSDPAPGGPEQGGRNFD